MMFLRAIRRQISINKHKKALLKQSKVSSAMVLAMEQKEFLVKEQSASAGNTNNLSTLIKQNYKANALLEDIVFNFF